MASAVHDEVVGQASWNEESLADNIDRLALLSQDAIVDVHAVVASLLDFVEALDGN